MNFWIGNNPQYQKMVEIDRKATIRSVRDFLADGRREAAQYLLGHFYAMRAERAE